MRKFIPWLVGAVAFLGLGYNPAKAQQTTTPTIAGIACAYNSSLPTLITGNYGLVQCDANGRLILSGTITAGGTASAFGAAFPSSGTAIGLKSFTGSTMVPAQADAAGNLDVNCIAGCAGGTTSNATSGVATSSTNGATVAYMYGFNGSTWDQLQVNASKALKVDGSAVTQPISAASLPLPTGASTAAGLTTINTTLGSPFQAGGSIGNTTFGISGTLPAFTATPTFNVGTIAGIATAANQTNATQKTQLVDASGNVIASTSNNLNVQCANCSGSGVSTADEATFTAGTSLFAGSGGFFQTTATNNPLTTGQQGEFQVTANRALFTNPRNAAGTEIATATAPFRVDPTGTTTQPVNGTVTANAGTNLNTSALALDTSIQGLLVSQGGAIAGKAGPMVQGSVTTAAPTYTTGTVNPLSLDTAGNLRVNVVAGSASGNVGQGSTTSGETGPMAQGAVTTAAPTYTTGQTNPLSIDTAGNLRVTVPTAIQGGTVGSAPPGAGNQVMQGVLDSSGNVANPSLIGAQGGPLEAQAADLTTASTPVGTGGSISVVLEGERGVVFQLQSGGTGVYTVTPQCSSDAGVTYPVNGSIVNPVTGITSTTATISSGQATTDYPVLCPTGSSNAQMNVTAFTSGTANWLARSTTYSPIAVVYGTDGNNIRALPLKPPSTAPVLTDPAVVVAQSPNPAPVCTSIVTVNQTASTDIATLTNFGYICTIILISDTPAQKFSIVEGTGTNCGTLISPLIGGTAGTMSFAANGGFSAVNDRPWLKMKTSGDHLCIIQTGTSNISGIITYQDHA